MTDAEAILHDDPAVQRVSYLTRQAGQVAIRRPELEHQHSGRDAELSGYRQLAHRGRCRDDRSENDSAELVCLIGQTVYQNLFPPGEDPVGAVILIKGVPVRVIGLLVAKGQTGYGQDQDDLVMIPFNTAERKVLGVAAPQSRLRTSSAPIIRPRPTRSGSPRA